jgi:hypothetical protein
MSQHDKVILNRTAARPEVAPKSRDKLVSGSPFEKEVAHE